jgi:Protein of unknown function (DUF3108)
MLKHLITAVTFWIALLPVFPAQGAPQSVRAQYDVTMNGAPIGVMQDAFDIRDNRYQIISETHATGVLALVQRRPARVTSSGEVDRHGLRPQTFEAARGSSDARRARADFDWSARTLTLTHDNRSETVTLPAATQDRLSVMYQFLFLAPEQLRELKFAMTNGRKLDQYRYAVGPDTALDTPLGRLPVIHLVKQLAPGDTATELWLAKDHGLLPVKMRIVEDDGSRFEQLITRIEMPAASQP